jgi:hypothetical protein
VISFAGAIRPSLEPSSTTTVSCAAFKWAV